MVTPKWLVMMIATGCIGMICSIIRIKMVDTRYLYGTIVIFALALSVQDEPEKNSGQVGIAIIIKHGRVKRRGYYLRA